ncbi:MAG: hypothetical protein AB7L66_03465 [Gemmatimonadales bacterium]
MTARFRILAVAFLLTGAATLGSAQDLRRAEPTSDQLLAQVSKLEARVAQLESVLSLVGGTVTLGARVRPW